MSEVHKRVKSLLVILNDYRNLGRVELLQRHECDIGIKASRDYASCFAKIKVENRGKQCVFLSSKFLYLF